MEASEVDLPDIPEWPQLKKLAWEKETVGFYLTGHPLQSYIDDLRRIVDLEIGRLQECREGEMVRIGGLVSQYRDHKDKKGNPMAFVEIEDVSSSVEVVVFPRTFQECDRLLTADAPVIVQGKVQKNERGPKIIAEAVYSLVDGLQNLIDRITIRLPASRTSRPHMEELKELFYRHHGRVPLSLVLHFDGQGEVFIDLVDDLAVAPSPSLFKDLARHCGRHSIQVISKPVFQQPQRFQQGSKHGQAMTV